MTTLPRSREPRNAFANAAVPTLADVIVRIDALDLARRHKADLASAVRTVAKVLDRQPSELPASPAFLRTLMERAEPARWHLSPARWANIRSLLRKAMELTGIAVQPGRYLAPLSPAWKELDGRLPTRALRIGLSRLMRYCSSNGIAPEEVSERTFEDLLAALEHESLLKSPRTVHRDACRMWNAAAETVSGWPQLRVVVPCYRDTYILPWSAFPDSLRADVEAMAAASVATDLLSEHQRRPIKQVSAACRVYMLRQFASVLVHRGHPASELRCIADLITISTAKEGLRFYLDRYGNQKRTHLHQLTKLFATLGRHWVRVAPEHQKALDDLRNHLAVRRHGMTDKNRRTLRQFASPALVARFLTLPSAVVERTERRPHRPVADAVAVQLAVAIELLIVAPVRIKNLSSIDLDRHLVSVGAGAKQRLHLHFPAAEVKNDVDLEFPLPESTAALLQLYLDTYRPRLVRTSNRWLFPGEGAGHKGSSVLGTQISGLIKQELGIHLTPHQFRHVAGYLYLRHQPGGHEVVRRLLGHKSISTTLAFYAGMEVDDAVRHYDEAVLHMRNNAATAMRAAPRRHGGRAAGGRHA